MAKQRIVDRREHLMVDRVSYEELEIFVGSDKVVRINVDGVCAMRIRVEDFQKIVIDLQGELHPLKASGRMTDG